MGFPAFHEILKSILIRFIETENPRGAASSPRGFGRM
jgi:hypothetical protein